MGVGFKNKVAWITGASAGIGEALALALSAENASLVLSARKRGALEKVAGKCRATGAQNVWVQPLDMADEAAVEGAAVSVLEKMGRIDFLFNNAGVSQRALVKDAPMDLYHQMMQVNFFGTIALTKALLPGMMERKSGHIITISSLAGKFGTPLRSGYAASKHALHGFFDSLRAEVHDDNIKVLLVCPGFIKTDISVNALAADGSATGKMDKNQAEGMPPEKLAQKILAAIKAGKKEIYVGGKEVLAIYLKRFLPSVVNKIVRKKY